MASSVFTDYYSTDEYDKELEKILTIDEPAFAAHLYHAVSRVGNLFNEQTVSLEAYGKLCDYLVGKFGELPSYLQDSLKQQDLKDHTCTLVKQEEGKPYVKGVNYYEPSGLYLEALEENMFTDFMIESWEDNASAN